jgi:ATP-binding cassette subfamily F protein 3
MLVWQKPNLLLLDEPTNHLDLTTREALAVALNSFEGSVLLVSHDRALLRSVCDEFWLVTQGQVSSFEGDLDDYQQHLMDQAKRARESLKSSPAPDQTAELSAEEVNPKMQRQFAAQRRQALATQIRPWRKELEQIDLQLAQLTQDQKTLQDLALHPSDITDHAEWGRRCKGIEEQIATLEERWLELSEKIEFAQQEGA